MKGRARFRFSRYDGSVTVDERRLDLPSTDKRWKTAFGCGADRLGALDVGQRRVAITADGGVCIIEREGNDD